MSDEFTKVLDRVAAEWADVRDAILALHETESEFKTDPDVYTSANRLADLFCAAGYNAPRIWAHGPRSVVFEWPAFKATVEAHKWTVADFKWPLA